MCGSEGDYAAASEEAGRDALERFGGIWNGKYPMIHQSWEAAWNDLCEFFKYPP
jgi:transposase-like protein